MRSRPYQRVSVKNVDLEELLKDKDGERAWVGVDVSKGWFDVVVRWGKQDFERPWKADSPGEIGLLISRLARLKQGRELAVAMESSGTYGEPFRKALTDAGIEVRRVSGKSVKDYEEIFDGVPWSHDGKAAAIIAELASTGKSSAWAYEPRTEAEERMRLTVDLMDSHHKVMNMWTNRIEAELARQWPEATSLFEPSSATLLRALAEYGGPGLLAAQGERGAEQLKRWGGNFLKQEKARSLAQSAARTVGVDENEATRERLKTYASEALLGKKKLREAERRLKGLADGNAVIQAQRAAVGLGAACVLWVELGDPAKYSSAGAYRKAMGLNLKVRSSGKKFEGHLKITKRGPSRIRRWLYYAALRWTQDPAVERWYQAKVARDGGKCSKALVGIMRKLALASYHVGANGVLYEPRMLFSQAVKQPVRRQGAGKRR